MWRMGAALEFVVDSMGSASPSLDCVSSALQRVRREWECNVRRPSRDRSTLKSLLWQWSGAIGFYWSLPYFAATCGATSNFPNPYQIDLDFSKTLNVFLLNAIQWLINYRSVREA